MGTASIEVRGVHKRFGTRVALDGMSFEVEAGKVTGFVGPNGAGKSTTMRVVLGLDRLDDGTALVCGRRYRELRQPFCHVGALLDAGALQPGRSARNHLLWIARSQGLPTGRVDEVLALVGLGTAARRRAGAYSLGMRQRLGIAAAMLGDPPVLMMDEPFNGMDPEGIVWMRGFLRGLSREGRAIFVSSHLMNELEGAVDHVVVVGRGRVIADASVDEIIGAASDGKVTLRTRRPADARRLLGEAGAHVEETDPGTIVVSGIDAERAVEVLGAEGVPFSEVSSHRASLEEAYLRLTGGEAEYRAAVPASRRGLEP